jgi:hypothetical protein
MFRQVRLRPREQRFQGGVFLRERSEVHARKESYLRRFRHVETDLRVNSSRSSRKFWTARALGSNKPPIEPFEQRRELRG